MKNAIIGIIIGILIAIVGYFAFVVINISKQVADNTNQISGIINFLVEKYPEIKQ